MNEYHLGSIVRAREILSIYRKFRENLEKQIQNEKDPSYSRWNSQNHLRIQLYEANAKIALLKAVIEFFAKSNDDATLNLIQGLIEEIPPSTILLSELIHSQKKVESLIDFVNQQNQMEREFSKKKTTRWKKED